MMAWSRIALVVVERRERRVKKGHGYGLEQSHPDREHGSGSGVAEPADRSAHHALQPGDELRLAGREN